MDKEGTLALIGLTQAELQERVIARLCSELTTEYSYDENGNCCKVASTFAKETRKAVVEAINDKITKVAEEHIFPKVGELIDNITLQETNRWGEARGEKLTFTEYLTKKAETYFEEKVDINGKTQKEGGYNWKGTETRLTSLIHAHLKYYIETAMKNALKTANNSIINGLEETVRMKLAEISQSLKVTVKV